MKEFKLTLTDNDSVVICNLSIGIIKEDDNIPSIDQLIDEAEFDYLYTIDEINQIDTMAIDLESMIKREIRIYLNQQSNERS